MKTGSVNKWIKFTLFVILLIGIDQLTKILALNNLKGKANVVIIPNIFELEYLENRGAAFGSFQGAQIPLIIVSLIIIALIIWKYGQIPEGKRFYPLKITLGTLMAGAFGNLIDRIFRNYVIDFLYFKPIDFPRFNVADSYVTLSVISLAILVIFVYQEKELDFLFALRHRADARHE